MCYICISFIFIKNIFVTNKSIEGDVLYRQGEKFREIIFKGFTGGEKLFVNNFDKNSIVHVVGE